MLWPTCWWHCPHAAEARPDVVSVDLNPLIVADGRPVAVDALVEVDGSAGEPAVEPGPERFERCSIRRAS